MKSTSTRPGDRYLKGALGIAALSVIKRKDTYFWANFSGSPLTADRCERWSPLSTP